MNSQKFEVTIASLMLNQIKDTHKKYSLNKWYQHEELPCRNPGAEMTLTRRNAAIHKCAHGYQTLTFLKLCTDIQNATLRLVQDEQFPN